MSVNIHAYKILILDFGSQYTQLIARRVRELGVYCELHPFDVSEDYISSFQPSGIILSGSPESVYQSSYRAPAFIFEGGVPILGICYGMQTMAVQLGGSVHGVGHSEFGHATVNCIYDCQLLKDIPPSCSVWMSHGDKVDTLPEGFELLGYSANAPVAIMGNLEKHLYGVQFHPEVTHSEHGLTLLKNFIYDICGCPCQWTAENIIQDAVDSVREQVGEDQVLLGLSGGVDSSVVAALLHQAIGKQLVCVFVDTGLLREGEGDQVMETFARHMGIKVIRVNAKTQFFKALTGITEPEEKRKICGRLFVEVFEEEAEKLEGIKWLAQGTIYPDVIESAKSHTGKAQVIKSHHNVGGLPERMKLNLLEPLRELFKDEVRKIGLTLGLPSEMVYRHPFPGPGLCVRILGEVREEFADILRKADAIFIEHLRLTGWYEKVAQAFVVFLPVKSVGVKGDYRSYEYVVSLRAVETVDFMTARWAHLPYDLLSEVAHRIVNEIPRISRVTYDITGKPPATIEWE